MIQNMSPCDSTLPKNEAESTEWVPRSKIIFLSPGKIIKNFCEEMRRKNTLEHLPEYKSKYKINKLKYWKQGENKKYREKNSNCECGLWQPKCFIHYESS